jgi:hypothetical protein
MTDYNDIRFNHENLNNFNEGKGDTDIVTPGYSYQYNGLSPEWNKHGYALSLACQSGTDTPHAIGNVTAIVLQFIVDQFPNGTFATVLPSTRLTHRQLLHTPKQIRSQPYPMCIVTPRVSLSGIDNRLAAGSIATTLWQSTSIRYQNRSEMERLFFDSQKGIEWRGKINRVVVNFDFVLSFQSMTEQMKWASYLINRIPTDNIFFDIDTALELAIPDGFLQETARYAGMKVKDEHGSVAPFVDYLNMNSVYPISYRFSSGKHKDCFYSYYMTSLLCSISELNYSNVTKANMVETDCPVTFTLRCEFNTIGMFDLSVPNPGPYRYIEPSSGGITIPIFSDVFNEKDFPLPYGWKIHSRPIIKLDIDETEICFNSVLGYGLEKMLDYHIEHHISPDLFINVMLRENNVLIDDGYYIDWNERKVKFQTVKYQCTYRLIISINQLYINDMLKMLYLKDDNGISSANPKNSM